jgi:hypothetical protein
VLILAGKEERKRIMKATISPRKNDNLPNYRKENALSREIAALDPKTGRAVVTLRTYYPNQTAYACVWIHAGDVHARGGGKAGGGGYCKESAAAHAAQAAAGVTLSESVNGRGMRAVEDAVLAAARAATGKRKFLVHVAHG